MWGLKRGNTTIRGILNFMSPKNVDFLLILGEKPIFGGLELTMKKECVTIWLHCGQIGFF